MKLSYHTFPEMSRGYAAVLRKNPKNCGAQAPFAVFPHDSEKQRELFCKRSDNTNPRTSRRILQPREQKIPQKDHPRLRSRRQGWGAQESEEFADGNFNGVSYRFQANPANQSSAISFESPENSEPLMQQSMPFSW